MALIDEIWEQPAVVDRLLRSMLGETGSALASAICPAAVRLLVARPAH